MKQKLHYAWLIVFVTFLTLLAVQGVRLSFGAFIKPWEEDFSLDRGTISLISMLSFIVYGVSQPVIGRLVDRVGPRIVLSLSTLLVGLSIFFTNFVTSPWQLFILYGIIVSLGVGGASNIASTIIVTNWFNEKRGLALGIMEAGFGAGQMLLVPGSLILIDWFNWKVTVCVLGIFLTLIIFPIAGLFLRNNPTEKNMQPVGGFHQSGSTHKTTDQSNNISYKSAFINKRFWLLILPFFICGFTTTGLMDTHLIPFSHDHGFSTSTTSVAVSLLAGFNIIGILISGLVADRFSNRKLLCFLYAMRAVSLIILLLSHEPLLLLGFAVLFGLVDFATVTPTQMLAAQYFRQYSVGFILGWLFFSHQIGSALGAYLPGVWYSQSGSYNLSFTISIILLICASMLNILLPELNKSTRNLDNETTC
ncbi:MFS transporter [Bacillus changyiensis]|uniref:MFS transporter n=1 Tax=Bacillus changyiensis TaxID=3004103 RepID=UPI0022E008C1|nr:MFS transporter [Bacillus changyiensis]MDA1477877.1 MFS transporter [Bacillus changyiensis]